MNRELIELEEELIIEQLRLEQEAIKLDILSKLDRAESLFSKSVPETITFNIDFAESLGKGLTLPLMVRGVFLVESRPKRRFYLAEELQKAVVNPMNKRFPIKQDHRDGETSVIIGVVEKLVFDNYITLNDGSVKAGIRFWGHINDETTARNILDGIITDVSVTVYAEKEQHDNKYGLVGRGLTFSELSTVVTGSVNGNFIEPDL